MEIEKFFQCCCTLYLLQIVCCQLKCASMSQSCVYQILKLFTFSAFYFLASCSLEMKRFLCTKLVLQSFKSC